MLDTQVNKIPHKKVANYWRSILIIMLIIVIFLLQSCSDANKHGAATPDRIVEQYLLALADRDESLLIRLAPESSTLTSAMKTKILRFGGHKIQDIQTKYTKSKPTLWNAKVQGFYVDAMGTRQNFDDSLAIEYQSKGQVKLYGGRWYLLLGDRE